MEETPKACVFRSGCCQKGGSVLMPGVFSGDVGCATSAASDLAASVVAKAGVPRWQGADCASTNTSTSTSDDGDSKADDDEMDDDDDEDETDFRITPELCEEARGPCRLQIGELTISATPQPASTAISLSRSELVVALAKVLTHLTSLGCTGQHLTRFHATSVPRISIHEYLTRIAKYFYCSEACLVLGLVYIDRLVKLHPEFVVSILNIHRLLLTSTMLAAKWHDEVFYSNDYYARVGGVRSRELETLEVLFLKQVDWRLYVLPEEYDQYLRHLLLAVQGGTSQRSDLPLADYRMA